MKKAILTLLLLCSLFFWNTNGAKAQEISIIPKPVSLIQYNGAFHLNEKASIGYDATVKEQAQYLSEILQQSTGYALPIKEKYKKAAILLRVNPTVVSKEEGYKLTVAPKQVTIVGHDKGGVFYGIQSLLQLFPSTIYSRSLQRHTDWALPLVEIEDAPNHPYRGMMLDVARYFFNKAYVKKFIDMMAMYKMNKLHFHLIDDSGWRLEIKKYPRLTEVGAWAGPKEARVGGFYTQDDIRELVAYAQMRNVEIIPEIEFPAHILSAVVAYPWLSCTGMQHELPVQHFISRDLLCAGKESSIKFLSDILEETCNLFPSKYINIGGDEAVYDRWKVCSNCQALMKKEGLTEAGQLQGYLTNVVSDLMKAKGRTIMGWEEIIQRGKIHNPAVALIWHNVADTLQATNTGHKALLVPATHTYLDFPESKTPGEIKSATWMPPISLEKCYSMEINNYSPSSTVIGVQGAIWSDQFIHGSLLRELPLLNENRSENYLEYLLFPRLLAVSELGWSLAEKRNYGDFSQRVQQHYAKLEAKECHYRVPEPIIVKEESNNNGVTFTLEKSVPNAKIVYTTDGSYPNIHSSEYKSPVTVEKKEDFHAMTVLSDSHYSLPIHFSPDYSAYAQFGSFTAEWTPLQVQTITSSIRFECTGKITSNGTYGITFVRTKGQNDINLSGIKVLKRDELVAEAHQTHLLSASNVSATYQIEIHNFEAGTPFYIDLLASGAKGNDVSGLVFIKMISKK